MYSYSHYGVNMWENQLDGHIRINSENTRKFNRNQVLAYLYGFIKVGDFKVPLSNKPSKPIRNTNDNGDSGYNSISNTSSPILKPQIYPPNIKVEEFSLGKLNHISVITTKYIKQGTVIDIFKGEEIHSAEKVKLASNKEYVWGAYHQGTLRFVLDGENEADNWVKHISKARNSIEQNIEVVYNSTKYQILFVANKDIQENSELLAWYAQRDWFASLIDSPKPNASPKIINTSKLSQKDCNDCSKNDKSWELNNPGEYTCDKCGSVFNYQYYLERHKKYTSCVDNPNRKFSCTLCTRTFEKAERLRVHVRQVHDKIKPYKCTTCSKEFSQSSSLTKHTRIHSGLRPYPCPLCGKKFTASSILTTHLRQHNGEKPFKCIICKKGFASHAAHHSHVRRSHGLEPKAVKDSTIQQIQFKEESMATITNMYLWE
ncbi:hypothetical protein HZS_6969, partial [Henneguya salminicola]